MSTINNINLLGKLKLKSHLYTIDDLITHLEADNVIIIRVNELPTENINQNAVYIKDGILNFYDGSDWISVTKKNLKIIPITLMDETTTDYQITWNNNVVTITHNLNSRVICTLYNPQDQQMFLGVNYINQNTIAIDFTDIPINPLEVYTLCLMAQYIYVGSLGYDYNNLLNKPIIDSQLNSLSTNAVQNSVVTNEFNNFIPKSGGIINGSLINSNQHDFTIFVGPTREITSLEDAFNIAQNSYVSEGHGIIIVLDPYQEDGITQAVYEISNNITISYGSFKIISYINNENLLTKPKITGNNSQLYNIIVSSRGFVSFENIEFENITLVSVWHSTINLVWCNINITNISNDIQSIFLISSETFSLIRLRGCNINGIILPNDRKTIALNCENGSQINCDVIESSTINNFNIGAYCQHNSYIKIQSNIVNLINVEQLSTPVINTIGNHQSYVER